MNGKSSNNFTTTIEWRLKTFFFLNLFFIISLLKYSPTYMCFVQGPEDFHPSLDQTLTTDRGQWIVAQAFAVDHIVYRIGILI